MTAVLRVVRGRPSDEELAALVTALATRAAAYAAAARHATEQPRSVWADPARRLRVPLPHGPDAWRRSGLPG